MPRLLQQSDCEPTCTRTSGPAPLTVGFYFNPGNSSVTVAWKQYSDKDGTDAGLLANYTYSNQGTFQALLIVRDGSGNIICQKDIPITVTAQPNDGIKFSQQDAIGYAGALDPRVDVDISGFSPQRITWNFGDQGDFSDRNPRDTTPMYTYKKPGTYNGYVVMDTGDGSTMIRRDFQVIVLPSLS